jgi:hypothetical protein
MSGGRGGTTKEEGEAAKARDASVAQPTQFAQLVPDLSKVDTGTLTVSGDQAIGGSALALRALAKVAAEVADNILAAAKGPDCTILVTSELDLATSDALFLEVRDGLSELEAAAEALLAQEPAAAESPFEVLPVIGAAAALSAAIPSALSLLAARRSITTYAINPDDTSAAIAVCGALAGKGVTVLHDQFRVLTEGEIHGRLDRVQANKQALIRRQIELSKVNDEDPDRKLRIELIANLITAIESYLTAISSASSAGGRSALTNAILREVLHDAGSARRFAVLVKGYGGSSAQLVNDRPFWFKDVFCIVTSMGITFLLVDAANGQIAAGGSRSGTVSVTGKIGGNLEFKSSI